MGDVAMTVPVVRALVEQYPDIKVTIVSKGFFEPFFKDINNVHFFATDLKGAHKGIFGLYKLSRVLKAEGFDVVADLHNVLRSKILKLFFSGKMVVQIDKGRADKRALTSGKQFQQLKTTHQRYAEVFEQLGCPVDLSHPIFPKKAQLTPNLKTFVSNTERKTVGVAPFAAHKGKMYPLNQMEEVIRQLSKVYNVVLFGGGKKEIELLNGLEDRYDHVQSVAGKLSLEEELALISNLDVMLSMDSGNGHLAAMLGVKVITIWGVTHPYAGFSPFYQPDDYALVADRKQFPLIPTSVYGNTYPDDYENAAGSISVERIIKKLSLVAN